MYNSQRMKRTRKSKLVTTSARCKLKKFEKHAFEIGDTKPYVIFCNDFFWLLKKSFLSWKCSELRFTFWLPDESSKNTRHPPGLGV